MPTAFDELMSRWRAAQNEVQRMEQAVWIARAPDGDGRDEAALLEQLHAARQRADAALQACLQEMARSKSAARHMGIQSSHLPD